VPVEPFCNQNPDRGRQLLPVFHCGAYERPGNELPIIPGLRSQEVFEKVVFGLGVLV
jgi:hypothetical protein